MAQLRISSAFCTALGLALLLDAAAAGPARVGLREVPRLLVALPAQGKPCQIVRGQAHPGARVFFRDRQIALAGDASFQLRIPCDAAGALTVRVRRVDGRALDLRIHIAPTPCDD